MKSRFSAKKNSSDAAGIKSEKEAKTGVLLTNLGSPDAPKTGAVRKYLRQFLSDPRVVEIPRIIWLIILHGIILRVRPKKSALLYKSVWTEQGAPLLAISRAQQQKVASQIKEKYGKDVRASLLGWRRWMRPLGRVLSGSASNAAGRVDRSVTAGDDRHRAGRLVGPESPTVEPVSTAAQTGSWAGGRGGSAWCRRLAVPEGTRRMGCG